MLGNAAHVNLEHMPAPARRATHTLLGQARTFGAAAAERDGSDVGANGLRSPGAFPVIWRTSFSSYAFCA